MENMVIFHSYISLPESNHRNHIYIYTYVYVPSGPMDPNTCLESMANPLDHTPQYSLRRYLKLQGYEHK